MPLSVSISYQFFLTIYNIFRHGLSRDLYALGKFDAAPPFTFEVVQVVFMLVHRAACTGLCD